MSIKPKIYQLLRGRDNLPARNQLTVFSDDIFLTSYPRSGNTWIRFLLGTLYSGHNLDWFNMDKFVPDIYRSSDNMLKSTLRPRLLKSHHPFDPRYPKVLYISRTPEKVCESYFYFQVKFGKRQNTRESFDDFFSDFIDGRISDFKSWGENVESWMLNRQSVPNGFLFCRYEDFVKNTELEVRRCVNFLGIERTDGDIRKAIEWASADNMHRLEMSQKKAPLFRKSLSDLSFVKSGSKNQIATSRFKLNRSQIDALALRFHKALNLCNYQLESENA